MSYKQKLEEELNELDFFQFLPREHEYHQKFVEENNYVKELKQFKNHYLNSYVMFFYSKDNETLKEIIAKHQNYHEEIENIKNVCDYYLFYNSNTRVFKINLIAEINSKLSNISINDVFRENITNYEDVAAFNIKFKLKTLIDVVNVYLSNHNKYYDHIKAAVLFYKHFLIIKPFKYYNEITARIIFSMILSDFTIFPVIIKIKYDLFNDSINSIIKFLKNLYLEIDCYINTN